MEKHTGKMGAGLSHRVNRRVMGWFALFVIITALFFIAYLTNLPWVWIVAVGTPAVTMILILRHFANSILDENNGEEKQGRMFILPRPSGLGSQARPDFMGGRSNILIVKQEKAKDEQVGETHAYLPESAWTSIPHKEEKKVS